MADVSSTEKLNATLANLARDDLEFDFLKLKNINASQLKKIDEYEQQVHELKRQISTFKAMEEHLTSEIEILQKIDKTESETLTKKVTILEDEITHLKQSNADNVQYFEAEILDKKSEIITLTENLKKTESETSSKSNNDEVGKYNDEIYDLKSKMEEMVFTITEHEFNYAEAIQRIANLENKNANLLTQLNEVTECLNSTKHEFQECNELVRNLQDEIIVMQMELDKFKSAPLEKAAKGNSLFAEVDDNRVKLQKHVAVINKKYHDAKVKYGNKSQELQKLHMEYATLIKVIENKKDLHEDHCALVETYKRHIEKQNVSIKSLETELEKQKYTFNKLMSGDMKCAQELVSATRNELVKHQQNQRSESLALLMSEQNFFDSKKELGKCQTEIMQLRAQIVSLKQTIEELKIMKNSSSNDDEEEEAKPQYMPIKEDEPVKKPNIPDSNVRSSMFTYLDDDDWENIFGDAPIDASIDFLNKDDRNILMESTKVNEMKQLDHVNKKPSILQEIKENAKTRLELKPKKVSFLQSTVEPRTDRPGRKVVTSSTVHIPSLKRK